MSSEERAQAILDRYRPRVEAELSGVLDSESIARSELFPMLRYHLGLAPGPHGELPGSGGKMLRGVLCLLASEAVGGMASEALPAAAAYELVHGFTLLHDDIMDRDETRRGRPTVWKLWGVGQAITAGDAMCALAGLACARRLTDPAVAQQVLLDMYGATLAVCEGQQRDLAFEGRRDITVEDYLAMVAYKTGALFAAACASGVLIGGGEETSVHALRTFGGELGVAFQVQDDLLGLWGEEEELGKPVGSDLRQNKRSLPILQALASDMPFAHRLAARLEQDDMSTGEAIELAAEMEAAGIRRDCEQVLRSRLGAALAALASVSRQTRPTEDLRTLAAYLVERRR